MSVKYRLTGQTGQTCGECAHYAPGKGYRAGTCLGHEVNAVGGCELFRRK